MRCKDNLHKDMVCVIVLLARGGGGLEVRHQVQDHDIKHWFDANAWDQGGRDHAPPLAWTFGC